MENQHRRISGYRELSEDEIAAMNALKALGNQVGEALDRAAAAGADPRSIATARTQLQTGFMWAVRAIAQPGGF